MGAPDHRPATQKVAGHPYTDTRQEDMTKGPKGCGVIEHPEECLCDVHVTEPTTVQVTIPFNMVNGDALARYGKWDGTLVHWFELSAQAWPAIWKFRAEQPVLENRQRFGRGLPPDVYDYMRERIRDGIMPTPLKNEIAELYDVTIDKSYVTHLRKRMQKRGEL